MTLATSQHGEITLPEVARRFVRKLVVPGALAAFREVMTVTRDVAISIGLVLQQQAAARPQGIAVIDGERRWTWAAFNAQVNRYAAVLASEGLGKGEVVALHLGNRAETLMLVCAAAKLGAIAAMINTAQRGDALLHSLTLSNARLQLLGGEQAAAWQSLPESFRDGERVRLLWVSEAGGAAAPAAMRDLDQLAAPCTDTDPPSVAQLRLRDPCFYIFTSGTTGLPKASVMTHYRWYRSAVSMGRLTLGLRPDDVFYCCLPFYHNNALTLAFGGALVSGATLAIGARFSASRFWDEIRRYEATAFCYIGELLRYLLNQPPNAEDRDHRVRAILGNGLRPELWQSFKSRFGIERVHEFYAASEGTNGFINVLNFDGTCGFSPNGWALAAYDRATDALVRDAHGRCRRVGRGAVGLLLTEVSEKMPFDGYTRREDGEKKLMRDVFRRGDCWFDTGDLMRAQGWGHVQFVDRVGDTFRWQGENVATTEVEAAAATWPQIEDAVVYGVQVTGRDGRCGMLSCSLRAGAELDADGFAAHLRARLPRYAVPRFLRLRAQQDLTGTFKHQKTQLKQQGYDVAACAEPLWVLGVDDGAWRPLSPELRQAVDAGRLRL